MKDEINVVFHPEMIRAMFDCGTDQASRLKPIGVPGNIFSLKHPETFEVRKWEIIDISRHRLEEVAIHMHKREGFVSEEDFLKFWSKIYPEHLDPRKVIVVHMFKLVGAG